MAHGVLMPKSGISVESCIIGAWHKSIGDEVEIGDILFDYETDKATFECASTAKGTILDIFYHPGDEVEVLKTVCVVGEKGEDISSMQNTQKTPKQKEETPPPVKAFDSPPGVTICKAQESQGVSPRAKSLAAKLGINALMANPTGPDGRVIARDVDKYYQSILNGEIRPIPAAKIDADYKEESMPRIRKITAANMLASLHNSAQLTNHHSFDAAAIIKLREEYKKDKENGLSGITIGDMILFALSRTLKEFSYINAHIIEKDILRTYSAVHLGVAVDTSRGLMVPTIFNADKKTLKEISNEVKALAEQAQSGSINPDLLQGGTFTLSNLGTTGVEMFTPILNAPQVGILGVCGIVNKVKMGENGIELYPSIGLSLTYDHRAVDGAPASRFLKELINKLENFSTQLI